jgi:hypothetical protein
MVRASDGTSLTLQVFGFNDLSFTLSNLEVSGIVHSISQGDIKRERSA